MAKNQEQTLAQGLATTTLYKRNQGKLVRQLTAVAIAAIFILGAWTLSTALAESPDVIRYGIPGAISVLGVWLAFRVVNYPRFADFLISVQAEMDKVSWESAEGLKRATIVVIVTMFFLAMTLFVYDLFWVWLFRALNILQSETPLPDA